jgi:uncharacterized protein YbjT (DUF2867 family)
MARHLARRWCDAGGAVRVLAPASEADGWPAGTTFVAGSVLDPVATPEAFVGVEVVCLAGLAGVEPGSLRELTNLALAGGTRRVAVVASHGSDFEDEISTETWQWLAFERAVERAGAACAYVRPSGLFANALVGGYPISGSRWARYVAAGAPLRELWPRVAYPFMDEADLADVVAAVLTGDGPNGQVLDVSGPMISAEERVALLREAIDHDVALQAVPSVEDARRLWRARGWPEVTIDVTLYAEGEFAARPDFYREVIGAQVEHTERLLGRPVRTFADWLTRHAGDFRPA